MRKLRTRITVSLPRDLVDQLDRVTAELKETRSSLVEEWLRRGSAVHRRRALDDEISSYYRNRTVDEADDDEAIAAASGRAASKLHIDEPRQRKR